ncbi:TadE/TadG family type IV pilus assembly protein [Sphingomonas sp. CV7422]|uniref:TadE/TadG family type IV pilus assembly protein n=1 Tax=Sphingomonas sp. CV7422 TaxID=3018036 RepID=UPI0022FEAE38|nr:TadE/TadG family type IV pilus assembly protein [Sphingomonas sp. CV7422]
MAGAFRGAAQLGRRLWRDRRGSAITLMVVGLIPGIAALGSAIDTGRVYIVKSQLQAGVDAAALAGARAFAVADTSPAGRDAQAMAYFRGNFTDGYMGTTGLIVTPTFTAIDGRNNTTVRASAIVPMSFMRAFGFDRQTVTAVARAEIQPHPLEVMMVLDNTGSLKDNLPRDANGVVKTRITALKDAAKSFLGVLYQGGTARPDLAMGMVMYDITVNVGKLLPNWQSPTVIRQQFAFNDQYMAQYGGSWPANHLAWKGCVFADDSVKDLNSTLTYREPDAWDIDRTLPGEGGHPPLSPYFIPPMYVPQLAQDKATAAERALNTGGFYKVAGVEPNNNLYRLDATYADPMLNYDAYSNDFQNNPYRRWLYMMYIGLNDGAGSAGNDVITRTDGSYYDPAVAPWNFSTRTGTPFKINYGRIPNFSTDWKVATEYSVNPLGGSVNDGTKNRTEFPSPNWQCPEEALPVAYGRDRSAYTTMIDQKNAAIYPANGTLHHAGLLWGYRLLVRDDVFRRTNPSRESPKRALVFMTDGETALGTSQNGYTDRTWTFYGNYADSPISSTPGGLTGQSERRFAKTCASLQAEANPPTVYIVALTTTDANTLSMFEKCAPGHVYRTSDAATLTAAFNDIAAELVDLHLVQ